MRLIGIMELLFAVVAELSAVGVNDCLRLVGLRLQRYNIRKVRCPLMSACVRVLTFRRIILTVRLLHLAAYRG